MTLLFSILRLITRRLHPSATGRLTAACLAGFERTGH